MFYRLLLLFCLAHCFLLASAQKDTVSYAEKLGFPKGAIVLILHVDDVGMSAESNRGAERAMTEGIATSCSIMMPCSWVPDYAHYLASHPQTDAGLHLTLTSEWKAYRWGPVAGSSVVPGLTDNEGALWPSVEDVVKHAKPAEIAAEIKAQIDKARNMGIVPTHLDSHMGTLFATPAFMEQYIAAGIENDIPVMMPGGKATVIAREMDAPAAWIQQLRTTGIMLWNAGLPVLDDLHNDSYDWIIPDSIKDNDAALQAFKVSKYIHALHELQPGLTMMIMHCTDPGESFTRISDTGPLRKADMLAMMDPAFKAEISKMGIILTTWRELMERRKKVK